AIEELRQATLDRVEAMEQSIKTLHRKLNRPGMETSADDVSERKDAIALLRLKHEAQIPKRDPQHELVATEDAISEAKMHIAAVKALMRTADHNTLSLEYQKALSSFRLGSNGFILPPSMSDQVLSCMTDSSELAALMGNVTVAGDSVKFLVDKANLDTAAWGCETSCFANSPSSHDLRSLLGELEIKLQALRYVVCASSDVVEDASIDLEPWILGKATGAFRAAISNAIVAGDGVGKPLGILSPNSGIPICDVGPDTSPGQFTWQDLLMLKREVPGAFQDPAASYLMNQHTYAQCLAMSDDAGRALMIPLPLGTPGPAVAHGLSLNGCPVHIVSQMPDCVPGATPVAFGNWRQAYTVVHRKAATLDYEPNSAGFCHLLKFEARVGGGIICPAAARLLRIR
ncbi:MAG: phage major capsid protein, partial [Bradyrhizobium sp.]|nr:phage major capsid protein [Bradyrhizobium sp.]